MVSFGSSAMRETTTSRNLAQRRREFVGIGTFLRHESEPLDLIAKKDPGVPLVIHDANDGRGRSTLRQRAHESSPPSSKTL